MAKDKNNKKLTWLWILLIVLLIVVVMFGGYYGYYRWRFPGRPFRPFGRPFLALRGRLGPMEPGVTVRV